MAGTRGGGGVQHAAQLARVTERRPRVAAIRSIGQQQQQLRLVVKIRPCLVQYIVNGVVMCVITSLEPITDVAELVHERSTDVETDATQILIAVADGAIWRVTLPTTPLGVLHQVLLQQKSTQRMALSSIESVDTPTQVLDLMEKDLFATQDAEAAERGAACRVEFFYQVPGVQYIVQHGDCTVCTSVLAPSTLLWTRSNGDLTAQKPSDIVSAVELEELEAEQSTCVVAFRGHDEAGRALVRWLFTNEEAALYTEPSSLVLLQGDADGAFRYYFTSHDGKKAAAAMSPPTPPPRSGKLLEIGQPVQFIVPFPISSASVDAKERFNGSRSHGILIVGNSGHARLLLLLPSRDSRDDLSSALRNGIPIAFDAPVQSIVFVEALGCFLYCSNGAVYGFRASDLIHRSSSSDNNSSKRVASPRTDFSVKLPFVSGVVLIALHEDSQGISLIYASGRVVSMDQKHLDNAITHVLPRMQAQEAGQVAVANQLASTSSLSLLAPEDTNESRIKSLLQRISQVSASSTKLRTQSTQLDTHLRNLHAALLIQKHVAAHGTHSLFHCNLELSLVSAGALLHKKAVKLMCRIDANKLDFISSLSCWLVSIHVRSRKQLVTTFVLPLQDVLHSPSRGQDAREMLLDGDTLEYQDDSGGMLFVSCSLVFQPGQIFQHRPTNKENGAAMANTNSRDSRTTEDWNSLFSFALPLVQDKAFHLVQLSELLEGDGIPTSHMAIRAAFRQDQDPSLPPSSSPSFNRFNSNSNGNTNDNHPGLLLQGFQLWSALAAHWEDKSFAALWLRDMDTTKNSQQQQQQSHELDITPPSRFTMVFPAFAVQELTLDHVVAIVRSVMNFPMSMNAEIHESCHNQSGKFWISMKTFSGNLVVLRFSLAEGTILIDGEMLRPLEILLQCSSAEDLSVMRALLVENVPRCPGHEEMSMPLDDVFSTLSLEAAEFRDSLFEAEVLAGVVAEKISTSLKSSESSLCTDEVVRMLADVARVETQTLELYWKFRQVLNKFVI